MVDGAMGGRRGLVFIVYLGLMCLLVGQHSCFFPDEEEAELQKGPYCNGRQMDNLVG